MKKPPKDSLEKWRNSRSAFILWTDPLPYICGAFYMLSIEPMYHAGSIVEKTVSLFNGHSGFALFIPAKLLVSIQSVMSRRDKT